MNFSSFTTQNLTTNKVLGKSLLQQLSLLDKQGWKLFLRWLQSPAHNTDTKLYTLGTYFKPQTGRPSPTTEKERLWAVLYPDKPLKEGVLRVKLRQFAAQLEDFIVWRQLKTQRKDYYDRLLLEAQLHHSSFRDFERQTLSRLKKMEQYTSPGLDQSYQRSALLFLLLAHPERDSYKQSNTHALDFNTSLDTFFVLSKFRIGNQLQNRARILGESLDLSFWSAVQEATQHVPLANHPVVITYLDLFELLQGERSFDNFQASFLHHQAQLPAADRIGIYYATLNYLTQMINSGQPAYYPKTLAWYQLGLVDDLLLPNGRISEVTFNNITLLAYQSEQFQWVENFLDNYQATLQEDVREDAVRASRGLGFFYQKSYRQAVQLLSGHRFSVPYQLRVRLTVARALYELLLQQADVYEELEKHLSTFDSYLRRNKKFSAATLLPYQNHLRLLRRLMNWYVHRNKDTAALQAIQQELEDGQRVVAKGWLQEKVVALSA